jgi:hypothetical protein
MSNDAGKPAKAKGLKIFRGETAQPLVITDYQGMTPAVVAGLDRLGQAGVSAGADVRTLFEMPGFSLTYAWFKSGFPLPLHSHEADCLYYIVGGSLRLGTEQLHKGDGFFVPANTAYTYSPGSNGVEVIEMRHESCNDIKFRVNNEAYWERAVRGMAENATRWRTEKKPESVG